MVKYSSTRGADTGESFRHVVMTGLSPDGGLYVPETIPTVSSEELESMRSMSYPDMAAAVMGKFVEEDDVPGTVLRDIVGRAFDSFRVAEVTPVVDVNGHAVLELFHGPTFAFKDVALQCLGNFFEYFLSTGSNEGRLAVLGATSGDTGSAAIAGLRGKAGVDCIILYPKGRVSEIQERQMVTVPDKNIHCLSVENGTFDDCQDIVKASFNDPVFRAEVKLGAVNSINWARVLAQITYYYWSYLRVTDAHKDVTTVSFSVPTGNFGDVLAGYYARRMGLPVGDLVVATNENDILHRFFTDGKYHRHGIEKTISPSMDICVSSNFERYLYHLANDDAKVLAGWMKSFEATKELTITGDLLKKAQSDFLSARADTEQTLALIKQYHADHKYMLCPHSAVGVSAIHQLKLSGPSMVCLATAHPAKFPEACKRAVDPLPTPPIELSSLFGLPVRNSDAPNDAVAVQNIMRKKIAVRVAADAAAVAAPTSSVAKGGRSKEGMVPLLVTAAVAAAASILLRSLLQGKK